MSQYVFDTDLFGKLEVPADDGIYESFTITLEGREITTDLYIMEDFLSAETQSDVALFLGSIPQIYATARKTLLDCRDTNGIVRFFIASSLTDADEDEEFLDYLLGTIGVASRQDITKEAFLQALEPRCIRIGPDRNSQVDCTLDFSLDEEYTDQLLVVMVNTQLEVYDITHES